jgi:hypothetical protein
MDRTPGGRREQGAREDRTEPGAHSERELARRAATPRAGENAAMSSARASLVLSTVALFVALCGGAVALQGKNSVNSGDIKDAAVKSGDVKDESLKGKDVDVNTLEGSDIDEDSLSGLQLGNGESELSGGHLALLETVTLAETPAGVLELQCIGAPNLRYTNETGTDVTALQTTREIVFEDDGIASNGAVAMSRALVAPDATDTANLAGVGALGSAEYAIVADETVVLATARAFTTPDGCDYVARVEHAPADD